MYPRLNVFEVFDTHINTWDEPCMLQSNCKIVKKMLISIETGLIKSAVGTN